MDAQTYKSIFHQVVEESDVKCQACGTVSNDGNIHNVNCPTIVASKKDYTPTKSDLEAYITGYLGDSFFGKKFAECIDLIKAKNSDYTEGKGSRDRVAHFRAAAEDLQLPMMKIWQVFVRKHWSTVQKFANGGKLESEPIDGRINDIINYMVLFAAIIEDMKEEKK